MKLHLASLTALSVLGVENVAASEQQLRSNQHRRTWAANIKNIQLTSPSNNAPNPTPSPTPYPTRKPTLNPTPAPTQPEKCNLKPSAPITEPVELVNRIYEIQSEELTSPFVGQTVYNVPGIVTAVNGNRFFMQDLEGDNNRHTSDGIEVYTGTAPTVEVGDIISLTGTVEEYKAGLRPFEQPTTRIKGANITTVSRGNALPNPLIIGANGRLPPTENMEDGVKFWESLEGMLIEINNPVVVEPTFSIGTKSYLSVVNDYGRYSTGFSDRGTLNVGPNDFNPELLLVDEYSIYDVNFPEVDVGTKFNNIVGVLGYFYGCYEVIPTEHFGTAQASTLEPTTTSCKADPNTMTVATYSFSGFDDDYDAVAEHMVKNMQFPDVIALQYVAPVNLNTLISKVREVGGEDKYTYKLLSNKDLAIFYNPWRIDVIKDYGVQTAVQLYFAGLAPYAALLKYLPLGTEFDIINVLFTDKDGSASIRGVNQPFEKLQEADDINAGLNARLLESNGVRALISGDNKIVTDPEKLIVLGAMNENEWVSPLRNLEGAGLKNLVYGISQNERYSVVQFGSSQAHDHIFVSADFCSTARGEYVHVNAEFSSSLGVDPMVACIDLPYEA